MQTQQELSQTDASKTHAAELLTPHITLINAYSARNIGDAGIVVATIRILRRLYPDCCIEVMSWYEQENRAFYQHYDVQTVKAVWHVSKSQSLLTRYQQGLRMFQAVCRGKRLQSAVPIQKADLVFSVGGGYIYSSKKGPFGIGILSALFHIWLAKRCGKKVIVGPKSIGPIRFRCEDRLLRRVLSYADCILVREPVTRKYLTGLGLSNLRDCADIAFSLFPAKSSGLEQRVQQGSPKIGITVLDWQFARHSATQADVDHYIEEIAAACRQVVARHPGAHLYIFPQVTVSKESEGDSDLQISEQLAASLGGISTLVQMPDLFLPEEAIALYRQMDIFIGSRMHSTIFALCGYVPTIALAYQTKTVGTFEILGLNDYVFDVQQIEAASLACRIHQIIDDLDAEKQKFREVVDIVRAETLRTMEQTLTELLPVSHDADSSL